MSVRSGTDHQILVRIKRGDSGASIVDELGCSYARIRAIAKAHGIERKTTGGAVARLSGEYPLKTQHDPRRITPWVRVALPVGWAVSVNYDGLGDEVIVLRRRESDAIEE